MHYKPVPKHLIQETQALVRLQLFLRYEVGLKEDIPVRGLKRILVTLKTGRE